MKDQKMSLDSFAKNSLKQTKVNIVVQLKVTKTCCINVTYKATPVLPSNWVMS